MDDGKDCAVYTENTPPRRAKYLQLSTIIVLLYTSIPIRADFAIKCFLRFSFNIPFAMGKWIKFYHHPIDKCIYLHCPRVCVPEHNANIFLVDFLYDQ